MADWSVTMVTVLSVGCKLNLQMIQWLYLHGVDVYYDKINSSVTFTYFEQHVSNPLVTLLNVWCFGPLPWLWCFLSNLVFKRFDIYMSSYKGLSG